MGSFLLQSRLSHSTLNEDKLVTVIAKHINYLGHKRAHQQIQDSRVEMKAGRKYVLVQNSQ